MTSVKVTSDLLEELGSCGDYVHRFQRLFPIDQYPDGVEVNEDVCSQHAVNFPWDWATEVMLSNTGYRAYQEQINALNREFTALDSQHADERAAWRETWNQRYTDPDWDTSDEARAAHRELTRAHAARLEESKLDATHRSARAFGRAFAASDDHVSDRVKTAHQRSSGRRDERLIAAYDRVVSDLSASRQRLEEYTAKVPELEERELNLRSAVAQARANVAEREAARLEANAERARASADSATKSAEEARAEAARLAALAAPAESTSEESTEVTESESTTGSATEASDPAENMDSSTSESEAVTRDA